jgi:hypothetical protein
MASLAEVVRSAENSQKNLTAQSESAEKLAHELAKLYHFLRNLMYELHEAHKYRQQKSCDCEIDFLAQTDSISGRMHEIAWTISETTVETLGAVHAKATVLKDWCGERADVKDALALSLCRDLDAIVRHMPPIGDFCPSA